MSRASAYLHPADEILQTMERIYRHRMTTTSGGNLSLREADGTIWITPAGVDKGGLTRDDIVPVRPDGSTGGARRPSSELPFHQRIYEARPDVAGVVHAHAGALVAFSLAHRVPDTRLFHHARDVCGDVVFAPYALPGSDALGQVIAASLAGGAQAAVLENHGIVTVGATLQQAFQRFETLEFTARTAIRAAYLGEVRVLTDEQCGLPRGLEPLPAFTREPAGSAERELRRQVCDFARRGYRQRLLISTEGSFSARLGADAFVITPNKVDRDMLVPEDLVLVQNGAAEAGKVPSRATRGHRAIYCRHPQVGALLNAAPVNATAFAVTAARLDSRTIPESHIVLRAVGRIPYGVQFERPERLADVVTAATPVAILENDGVLVAGATVLQAFDRVEVLEATAAALIDSRALGGAHPMPETAIADLERTFFPTS